jgi:hypothetical protein
MKVTPIKKRKREKDCKVSMSLMQVDQSELPKPDWVYTVSAQIFIEGNDEECNAEEVALRFLTSAKKEAAALMTWKSLMTLKKT